MDFFGVYHSDYSRSGSGICDAPCITKGRMTLCADGVSSQGSVIAMVDGRIRNAAALASALGSTGNATQSQLALLAYRKWGEDFPSHIEGPAVSCVMDADTDTMILSADRMGECPVFFARKGSGTAFANHPDLLLKSAITLPELDSDGLRELFGLGPARTPGKTFYKDMEQLARGCVLIIRENHSRVLRYFDIENRPHPWDRAQTVEKTRELLEQSVAEVVGLHPAVMLSGGLDSTALTALIHGKGFPLRSFSVDYQDNEKDFRANAFRPEMDAPYVAEAVRVFGTQHRTVTLDQHGLAEALGRAVSLRGFPGMADIDSSLLLFSREIARYDSWVVSGECGDEVFGGYPWFRGEAALEGFPWSGSLELRESMLLPEYRRELRLKEYVCDLFETRKSQADPGDEFEPRERRLRTMQKLCFDFFMCNLQERAVRMCEGAGIHVLTPMCDDRLVQFVYNVPWVMKFMGGQEKGLLRAAVADQLPEKLLRRTKSPYPKTCSPLYGRIVRGMALRMAREADAPIFRIVDRNRVVSLAESELDPIETPWFGQLMAGPQLLGYLWQINHWMRERNISF